MNIHMRLMKFIVSIVFIVLNIKRHILHVIAPGRVSNMMNEKMPPIKRKGLTLWADEEKVVVDTATREPEATQSGKEEAKPEKEEVKIPVDIYVPEPQVIPGKAVEVVTSTDVAETKEADELEEVMMSNIRGMHHISMRLRQRIVNHDLPTDAMTKMAKASAQVAEVIFRGVGVVKKYKQGNTQNIIVQKVTVEKGGNAIVGGMQKNELPIPVNEPVKVNVAKPTNSKYLMDLEHMEFEKGSFQNHDDYVDTLGGGV